MDLHLKQPHEHVMHMIASMIRLIALFLGDTMIHVTPSLPQLETPKGWIQQHIFKLWGAQPGVSPQPSPTAQVNLGTRTLDEAGHEFRGTYGDLWTPYDHISEHTINHHYESPAPNGF